MKSISLNIRASMFDAQTPPPADARITYNAKSGSHDMVGAGGHALGKFGLLRMRELLAHELIGANDHVYVSWAAHSGQAGVTSFVVRSCHVALGRQVDTSPTRTIDPSAAIGRVGPFTLGYTDELVLRSDGKGEQVVTLALLIGTAVEVERLLNRDQDGQVGDAVALHAETHQHGGSDPLDVTDLSGELADPQKPKSHASAHANGGSDELNVTGLAGVLAEPQPPKSHASSHHFKEKDEIKLDALGEPDDSTRLDATVSAHGLLRKLSGNSSEVLNGDGKWTSSAGIDSTAIHDDVAAEIASVTTKTTPGPTDWLLIEDDADSKRKKCVSIGALRFGEPTTVYELVWSSQATQLVPADGAVVVGGDNWTAVNRSAASQFRVLSGAGLQITATSGVTTSFANGLDSTSTAPALYCSLETLAAECRRYDLPLTIWSYFSAWNAPSSLNSIIAGVGGASSPYNAVTSGAGWLAGIAGGPPGGACLKRGGANTGSAASTNTHKVLVWRSLMDGLVDVYSSTWPGAWPARDALTLVGRDISGYGTTFSTALMLRRPGTALIYAAETRAASGSPSFTLARTRIQIG